MKLKPCSSPTFKHAWQYRKTSAGPRLACSRGRTFELNRPKGPRGTDMEADKAAGPLGSASSEGLGLAPERDGLSVPIRVKRELFRFDSKQQWINKGKSWYANCGVRQGFYIGVDAAGHVVHMGQCFMAAEERGLYPITVYELETNWLKKA